MEQVQIKYLADVPEFVPELAQWTLDAWGKYDPSLNLNSITNSLKNKLNKDQVPMTFVAVAGNKPVGMISIKPEIKVKGYEDRNLWLGSFWVLEEFRDQGIGTILLDKAYSKSRELGHNKISLFASDPNAPIWYSNHGWKQFAEDTYQGHPVVLMEYLL